MSQICESERSNDDRSVTRNQIIFAAGKVTPMLFGFSDVFFDSR